MLLAILPAASMVMKVPTWILFGHANSCCFPLEVSSKDSYFTLDRSNQRGQTERSASDAQQRLTPHSEGSAWSCKDLWYREIKRQLSEPIKMAHFFANSSSTQGESSIWTRGLRACWSTVLYTPFDFGQEADLILVWCNVNCWTNMLFWVLLINWLINNHQIKQHHNSLII